MIEFYEIVCAMVCFIVGYLIGDYYTTEKRKGELFEANHNKIEYKCEMERYKNKYESTTTTLKDLRDDYNSLKDQLKRLCEILEEDGYQIYLKYSPLVGWNGFVHKKRDKK